MTAKLSISLFVFGFVFKPQDFSSQAFSLTDVTGVSSNRGRRHKLCYSKKWVQDDYGITSIDDFETPRVNNRHSASDWLYNMRTLSRSSVLREIRHPVLSVSAWSTFITLIHRFLMACTSTHLQNIAVKMCIGTQIHSLLVSSLGLLLVFRTNSAYQRFTVGAYCEWTIAFNYSRHSLLQIVDILP